METVYPYHLLLFICKNKLVAKAPIFLWKRWLIIQIQPSQQKNGLNCSWGGLDWGGLGEGWPWCHSPKSWRLISWKPQRKNKTAFLKFGSFHNTFSGVICWTLLVGNIEFECKDWIVSWVSSTHLRGDKFHISQLTKGVNHGYSPPKLPSRSLGSLQNFRHQVGVAPKIGGKPPKWMVL